jgi:tetratricopeptide (TPR) repeat protein
MKAFFCELLFTCMLAGPGAKPVDELTYGTLLFSYYQNDFQQALVNAEVARVQNRRGDNPTRFRLATGSFAFSDGMYAYARETFESVAQSELTDLDRMRLAFHLAREYHRRGEHAALKGQLEQIDLGKTWLGRRKFHPEVEFMRAELAMAESRYGDAEAALKRVDEEDPLRAYGLFNLGVALRESEDYAGAERVFQTLADTELKRKKRRRTERDQEIADLKERAKLALSFIARQQQAPADAESVLGALPADSRYRDLAMASYGSLAMETEDFELAARIWLTLQNQDYWTSSTAQARLGFPVSLERLASQEMALMQYRAAERSFENRLAVLTDLNAQADDPTWVRGLLRVFSSPDPDGRRMNQIMERWQEQLGHTDWIEWLATEDTHEVLLEWRELLGMQDWLDTLPEKLSAFEEVAAERRRRAAEARALLHDAELLAGRDELALSIDRQAAELAVLKGEEPRRAIEWMDKLARDEERELMEELSAMRHLVERGMSEAERSRWLKRIDRLEGVLFWQIVDAAPRRLRELEKALKENQKMLADVDARIADVQSAEAEFAAGVETDFLAFASRADDLRAQVDGALETREVALAREIRRGMRREMREVQQYLLVTRIAIARASDQLAMNDAGSGS